MPASLRLTVNGKIHDVAVAAKTPLLYVLRNDLALNGPKFGCGLGECGACTVLIDDVAARSCVIPVGACVQRHVTTLEGLGTSAHPDPVQAAFIAEQAAQCGYCLNGMIMTTKALLLRNATPVEAEIINALRYNLCRCGAHVEILRAARRAAGLSPGDDGDSAERRQEKCQENPQENYQEKYQDSLQEKYQETNQETNNVGR